LKILTALTYYRPHISGLTIYAERVCRALAMRGHQVTVLTSKYERSLPHQEVRDGVRIFRVPVAFRVSKGVIMPTIGWHATRLVRQNDILHLHLPQLDATGIALRGQLFRHPVVLTYHCDLMLPPSTFHWLVERVVHLSNHATIRLADVVVTNTEDFARNSSFLSQYLEKVKAIFPPVEITPPTHRRCDDFRKKYHIPTLSPIIGIVGRFAAEKGIEYLLRALPNILEKFPSAVILHVGPREPVGELVYARRLAPLLEKCGDKYRHLGTIPDDELAAFFDICDVNVLPSVNNTESFGMVQVESAMCGTPSVASDLPGVRIATRETGMVLTVPPMDPQSLAKAICRVLENKESYSQPRIDIANVFSPETIAEKYEGLFERLLEGKE
jgi:glycosyltransferase involved in cell wall biosynthesis